MSRILVRALGLAFAAMLGIGSGLLTSTAASAADAAQGWLRVDPKAATTGDVMSVLTQAPCPSEATAVVVTMSGPNIPDDNTVGNIVGVIQLKALKPTTSGQLLVPVSFTFRDWFAVNAVQVKAGVTYTMTATCRDLLRASKTFGAFTAQVRFDGKGGFKAVGEAAKPFDTELKPVDQTDPLGGGGVGPGPESPGATATADPSASSSAVTPGESATASVPAGGGDDSPTTVAEPTQAVPVGDTAVPNVLLGAVGVLLLGLAAAAFLRRPKSGKDETIGQRERADAL